MPRGTARAHARVDLPPGEAAALGCATAAQVAQGLGTDHGSYDLDSVRAFQQETPTLSA